MSTVAMLAPAAGSAASGWDAASNAVSSRRPVQSQGQICPGNAASTTSCRSSTYTRPRVGPLVAATLAAAICPFPRKRNWHSDQPALLSGRAASKKSQGSQRSSFPWPLRWTDLDHEILQVWPSAVANLILPAVVGSVDLFWIAQSGDPHSIAGMGATNQVFNTIYFFFSFLPTIVTPRVAEEVRKERPGEAAKWVTEAFSFAALMGLVGTVILVGFPHTVLKLITDNPQVLSAAVPYCRIRGFSLIATLCYSVGFATYRGLLDLETPMKVALVCNMLNALLDPFLMNVLGLGVSGVAFATSVAEICSALVIAALLRKRKLLSPKLRLPAVATLKTFVQNGVAVQVRSFSTNLMFLLAVRRVTAMDPTGVQAAAYQVTQQFWNLAGYISLALSSSGAGLIPNKYWDPKAGKNEARRLADRLYLWGFCLGIILCLLQLACLPLVPILAPIEAVQEAARSPAILAALLQLMNGVVFAGEGILVGLRAYKWLAASSGFGCVCMVACLYLFGDNALTGLWLGLYLFNLSRLMASISHRLRFGPLAARAE